MSDVIQEYKCPVPMVNKPRAIEQEQACSELYLLFVQKGKWKHKIM